MEQKVVFLGHHIDRFIEAERIEKEGATLKNISDNLRSLAVVVAFSFAATALWNRPETLSKVLSILWGTWIAFVGLMTALQSGLLFLLVITEYLYKPYANKLSSNKIYNRLLPLITYFFAVIAFLFIFGAIGILTALGAK